MGDGDLSLLMSMLERTVEEAVFDGVCSREALRSQNLRQPQMPSWWAKRGQIHVRQLAIADLVGSEICPIPIMLVPDDVLKSVYESAKLLGRVLFDLDS